MASSNFPEKCPAELILHIIDACETGRDALALVSTCRALFRTGHAHAVDVSWSELCDSIPCFEEALITARMTNMVADAERRNELPPMGVSPGDFSSSRRRPTMPEMKEALALSRLAADFELAFRKARPQHSIHRTYDNTQNPQVSRFEQLPEEPARMPEWRTRVHKAILRVLIAGVALAGAYNEPVFAARSRRPELGLVPAACPRRSQTERLEFIHEHGFAPSHGPHELTVAQLEFLRQFVVCSWDASPEADEAVFGPLATWLLDSILADEEARRAMAKRFDEGSGRARYCHSRDACPVGHIIKGGTGDTTTHADAHLVVWEVMQMLWVQDAIGHAVFRSNPSADAPPPSEASTRVILLGVFQTEQVAPKDFPHQGYPLRDARLACVAPEQAVLYSCENSRHAWGSSAAVFFAAIHGGAAGWAAEQGPVPRGYLALKFFEYFLRRHLGLGLLCDDGILDDGYNDLLDCMTIFSHDDVEGRVPFADDDLLSVADFLDGSEVLMRLDG